MMTYIYDGSFQGLLTLIHDGILFNEVPDRIMIEDDLEFDLFSQKKYITSQKEKADKVIKTISGKFTMDIIRNIYYSFLSNEKDIEEKIYQYIRLLMNYGKNIEGFYANETVFLIQKAVKKVIIEKHRYLGILRFKLLKDGIYYSGIEPDNNVISLLITHFKSRFPDQKWMIHDLKRNIGVFYDGENADMVAIDEVEKKILEKNNASDKDIFDENEEKYQKLWKTFFNSIANKERKNPALQRKFIPQRYWKYLIEK